MNDFNRSFANAAVSAWQHIKQRYATAGYYQMHIKFCGSRPPPASIDSITSSSYELTSQMVGFGLYLPSHL